MPDWKSFLASSMLLTAAACGGDDGGGGTPIDADETEPDASPIDGAPTATRAGTIAIADVTATSPDAVARAVRGGAISIEFTDVTTGGGEVLFGTSPVGGCVVQRFDADGTPNGPNPSVDAGTITISGPAKGTSGLLEPVGPCNYVAGAGYLCINHQAVANDVIVSPGAQGTASYILGDQTLTDIDSGGSYLSINGLTSAGNNSATSAFPIVQRFGTNGIVVSNPAAVAEGTPTASDNVAYAFINGPAPLPGGPNYLDDEATSLVRIQKDADPDWGAIDFETYVRGGDIALDSTSGQPHEFPTTAAAITFSCGGDGDCGADGDGELEALIISGRTTDGDTTGLLDFQMPAPVTEYATFQCAFLLSETGTVPMEAVAAILSTSPTRIETRVLSVAGTLLNEGPMNLNELRILVGHGLVGHTTVPAN